jgi:hypothetical protein
MTKSDLPKIIYPKNGKTRYMALVFSFRAPDWLPTTALYNGPTWASNERIKVKTQGKAWAIPKPLYLPYFNSTWSNRDFFDPSPDNPRRAFILYSTSIIASRLLMQPCAAL